MRILRKAILVLLPVLLAAGALVGVLSFTSATQASPAQVLQPTFDGWVVTAVYSESAIAVINTLDHTVHGPFLAGELGSPGNLLDVVVTPDGETVLASNFMDQAVYFVDVSNPINPSVITSVTLPLFAEDIALSHDGRYALVTDGGFSNVVATLDVISASLVYTMSLGAYYAESVDIAPDGTVVLSDFVQGVIHSLVLGDSGTLTHTQSFTQVIGSANTYPINVRIAPDGQTVLVSNFFTDSVGVYQILSPGVLTQTDMISGLPGDQQSIAFSPAGDQALVLSVVPTPTDQVSLLDILGPGQVSLNTAGIANLKGNASGGFYGVDVMAVAGRQLFAGNPSNVGITDTLAVVDLDSWGTSEISLTDYPVGVAVIPPRRIFLPFVGQP